VWIAPLFGRQWWPSWKGTGCYFVPGIENSQQPDGERQASTSVMNKSGIVRNTSQKSPTPPPPRPAISVSSIAAVATRPSCVLRLLSQPLPGVTARILSSGGDSQGTEERVRGLVCEAVAVRNLEAWNAEAADRPASGWTGPPPSLGIKKTLGVGR